jgi:predicted esterase YcpF (UPF0227 family)
MNPRKLLYLHGFNSSPQSHKARLIAAFMQQHNIQDLLLSPKIPVVPEAARLFLEQLVEQTLETHQLGFAGSSLGGYYATYLAEKYNGTAALINPSVKPYETLRAYLGENRFYYENGSWDFNEAHIQQLQAMDVPAITRPERYLVLLQTGDEVLDYREAEQKYQGSKLIVEQGGDHAFTGFERYLEQILQFSQLLTD